MPISDVPKTLGEKFLEKNHLILALFLKKFTLHISEKFKFCASQSPKVDIMSLLVQNIHSQSRGDSHPEWQLSIMYFPHQDITRANLS